MRKFTYVLVVATMLTAAASASAQRPQRGEGGFGGFSGATLLGQKSVQSELGLSEEQVGKIDALIAKQRESFGDLRNLSREERTARFAETRKTWQGALDNILDGEQRGRFGQIALQLRGAEAFGDPAVADKLGLTDEQKTHVNEMQSSVRDEMRNLFQGDGDREQARQKITALRASLREKLNGVLTPEQQTKWQQLTGKHFEGQIRSPFGGGRRGSDGGPRLRRNRENSTRLERDIPVRLTSLREEDKPADDQVDDDGDDENRRSVAHPHKDRAGKAMRDRARPTNARRPSGEVHGRHHRRPTGPPNARGTRGDRAWEHVARMLDAGHRRPLRPYARGRGPDRDFGHHRDFSASPGHSAWAMTAGNRAYGHGPALHTAHFDGHRSFSFAPPRDDAFRGHFGPTRHRYAFSGEFGRHRHHGPPSGHFGRHRGPHAYRGMTMAHQGHHRSPGPAWAAFHRGPERWPAGHEHRPTFASARQGHHGPFPMASFKHHGHDRDHHQHHGKHAQHHASSKKDHSDDHAKGGDHHKSHGKDHAKKHREDDDRSDRDRDRDKDRHEKKRDRDDD